MKYAILLLLGAWSLQSFSQSKKISFKLGNEFKPPSNAEDLSFFGNLDDGLINVYSKNAKLTIISFNLKTLSASIEKTIELPGASQDFVSEEVVDMNGNYYWLHSDWNNDLKKESLAYHKIDIGKGKLLAQNGTMLETTKLLGSYAIANAFHYKTVNKYKLDFSADNKKMLVSYRLVPETKNDKKNYNKVGVHVFDENMNELWGGEFTMPYTEAVMNNSDFTVDKRGNAYMLSKVYNSDKRKEENKETGKPDYHYEILKFGKDSKTITQVSLPANDNFVDNLHLLANDNNELVIAGVYAKKPKLDTYEGVFVAVMNQERKIMQMKDGCYPFPVTELVKYESPRTRNKMEQDKEQTVPYLHLKNVVAEADGSIIISCEQVVSFFSTQTEAYSYWSILVTKINVDGTMAWCRKIPKHQRGSNPYTLGYNLIPDADGYSFLYLDNINNLKLADDQEPHTHVLGTGGQVMLTRIATDGKVTKEIVFDVRDEEDILLEPSSFKRLDDNHFIGRAGVRRLLKLTKFKPLLITIN